MQVNASAGREPAKLVAAGRVVLVVLLIACAVWVKFALGPVREDVAEYRWLTAHGTRETDTVTELGLQNTDRTAQSFIVETSDGRRAFIDLQGSSEKLVEEGVKIPVVLDMRYGGVGGGVTPDMLDRSFAGDYVKRVGPPAGLAVVLLLAAGAWEIRRRRVPGNSSVRSNP